MALIKDQIINELEKLAFMIWEAKIHTKKINDRETFQKWHAYLWDTIIKFAKEGKE